MPITERELFRAYAAGDGLSMTEAELLQGLTEAMDLAGWRWTHIRRSDGVTVGDIGIPDIIAAHPTSTARDVLAWELKSATGQPTYDQVAWLNALRRPGIDARVIRPADYDNALRTILGGGTRG